MPELGPLALFLLAALGPAAFAVWKSRDLTDPRVVFPVSYAYLTSGPILWFFWSGLYYPGIETDKIPAVLLSGATAVFAFHVGANVLLPRHRTQPTHASSAPPRRSIDRVQAAQYVLGMVLVGLLFLYMFTGAALRQDAVGLDLKGSVVGLESPTLRIYYLCAGLLIAGLTALTCYAPFRTGWLMDASPLVGIGLFGLIGLANGERDAVLPLIAWILVQTRMGRRRRAALMLAAMLFVVALVPLARQTGLAAEAQIAHASEVTAEDMLGSLATTSSANLFIFTKIAAWVPAYYGYSYGRTYLDAVLTLIPTGEETRARSLLAWFRDEYAPRGMSGYGFALDAEAYMNFGWLGPPVFFLAWGALLGWLHRPISRVQQPRELFYAVYPLVISVFAIRADFRGFTRMLLYGVALLVLVEATAFIMTRPRHRSARG